MLRLFFIYIFFLTYSLNSFAEKVDVVWSGFSINADFSDLKISAKYTAQLIERYKGKKNIIDETLRNFLKSNSFNNINILLNTEGISDETSKIAMSIFLDQEIFEEFRLPDEDCKKINLNECYIYNISNYYQLIFFDFKKMTYIKAVPFQSIYISDPLPKLSEEQKTDLLIESYKNVAWLKGDQNKQSENNNLTFLDIIETIELNQFYDFYLGINPNDNGFVINSEKIKDLVPDYMYSNTSLLKRHIANTFLGEIALKHNVVIVPYYEGYGIGNTLKTKYIDRNEVFSLTIPDPTYYIDITLRGFVKKEHKKDSNVKDLTWWIYGAGINLRFYEPLLEKEYLNIKLTKANYKKIPDVLKLTKINDFLNIINLTYKPLAIEFSNILNSDFKNENDKKWLEKVTKNTSKSKEIIEFKKFLNKIGSTK